MKDFVSPALGTTDQPHATSSARPLATETHTPGPWTYGWDGIDGCFFVPEAPNVNPLREEDARLIAAAPDLLAALKAEEEWRGREEVGALDPEWDYELMVGILRRAAIAKAEGR